MAENIKDFHKYLSCNNIVCRTKCDGDGREVLKLLLDILQRHYPDLDIEYATKEVIRREELFPTLIAPGLAVPHARLAGLTEPLIAMATCPDGVDFNVPEERVNVMILLLTPIDEPILHMQLMTALAKEFTNIEVIKKIAGLGTPDEVIKFFEHAKVEMADCLTAKDVMREKILTLQETDTLSKAIEVFSTSRFEELPVIDSSGDLRGVVSLSDLLRFCLPEHLLWMENLSPIYRFQPFSDMLKNSGDTRIADIMREEFLSVDQNVPAIQLAKLFLVNHSHQLIITDKNGRLAGVVILKEFCSKFFWE